MAPHVGEHAARRKRPDAQRLRDLVRAGDRQPARRQPAWRWSRRPV